MAFRIDRRNFVVAPAAAILNARPGQQRDHNGRSKITRYDPTRGVERRAFGPQNEKPIAFYGTSSQ